MREGRVFEPIVIFVAFFPCGPVCARYLRRYAREEQRHKHCCAWPCGRAVLSVCTHLIYSQVAVYNSVFFDMGDRPELPKESF